MNGDRTKGEVKQIIVSETHSSSFLFAALLAWHGICRVWTKSDTRRFEVRKTESGALACLIILTGFLYLLYTIIRFEKPRYYKGRLTGERKDGFYQAVTPEKLLASWGVDGSNPVIIKLSKKWEPRHSSGRLHKFIMEMDYYPFSSTSGFQAGRKMATKRIVIYRYMGANITNRMGIGILGYSDCVLSHSREFDDLVDSMSF